MADGSGGDMLGIGTAINAGVGLAKTVIGGIQALKGNKQMNSLLANRPRYNISQGYMDAFKTYQSLANSNLPGYDIMKGQIDQSSARTNTNLERGAMSSNQFMSGTLNSQDKELEAIKNLGLMSAQWKGQQQQNLAGAENQMGQLQDQQWQQNVLDPYNMKLNMANEKKQAGSQNLMGGISDIGSSVMNFAGTSAYVKAMQAGNKTQGIASSAFGQSQGNNNSFANWANPNFVMPKYNYNPNQ